MLKFCFTSLAGIFLSYFTFGQADSIIVQPNISLRGISAIDENICWASGSNGTVLRTTDGGENWKSVGTADITNDFRDIHAFDRDEAVIISAGMPAQVYRTIDGGENWEITYETKIADAFFDGFDFSDEYGIAYSDPVNGRWLLIETSDKGKKWRELPWPERPLAKDGQAGFAGSGTGIFALKNEAWFGSGGTVTEIFHRGLNTRDWLPRPVHSMKTGEGCGIFGISVHKEMGVAVGGCYRDPANTTGVAAYSLDGGKTWHEAENPPRGYRSGVVYSKAAKAFFAIGPTGIDSSGDGKRWKGFSEEGFHTASAAGDYLWVAGSNGRVKRFKVK